MSLSMAFEAFQETCPIGQPAPGLRIGVKKRIHRQGSFEGAAGMISHGLLEPLSETYMSRLVD